MTNAQDPDCPNEFDSVWTDPFLKGDAIAQTSAIDALNLLYTV